MTSLVVVSPHLDDGVFSCGSLISACRLVCPVVIVTVFAGMPGKRVAASTLDRTAGFDSAALAVASRRREDANACAILGCDYLHLDVLDGQYDTSSPEHREKKIAEALKQVLRMPGTLLGPWGIRHHDHIAVANALRGQANLLYEELPYRVLWSEYLPHDLASPVLELPTTALKQAAISCYRSQLGDGPAGEALYAAERYHRA